MLGTDARSTEVTRGVLSLAEALGLVTVAEGIEHPRQLAGLEVCTADMARASTSPGRRPPRSSAGFSARRIRPQARRWWRLRWRWRSPIRRRCSDPRLHRRPGSHAEPRQPQACGVSGLRPGRSRINQRTVKRRAEHLPCGDEERRKDGAENEARGAEEHQAAEC